eukprot:Lankesteria_metandrocarpae@DN7909_c0_g1_i1.p1
MFVIPNSGRPPLLRFVGVSNNPVGTEYCALIANSPHTLKIDGDQQLAAYGPPAVNSSLCKKSILERHCRESNAWLCPRCHALRNACQMTFSSRKDLGRIGWLAVQHPKTLLYM